MSQDHFTTDTTSRQTAQASPIVLRQSDRVRLVFAPQVVRNDQNPDASVNGEFAYQRKSVHDAWEDATEIRLGQLRSGEGVRLSLHSGEVLTLFRRLQSLYSVASDGAVPRGHQDWVAVPNTPVVESLRNALGRDSDSGTREQLLDMFLEWLGSQDPNHLLEMLQSGSASALISFDAAMGAARLRKFLTEVEDHLESAGEPYWQDLFTRESWAISQIYAYPLVIVGSQVYVGGKRITNRGGHVADFLLRNRLTDVAVVVEIKTPSTPLLNRSPYRSGVYACSQELAGAVAQLLQARDSLVREYSQLTSGEFPEFRTWSPKALLIVGRLPSSSDADQRRSFELYRASLRDLDVVTFEELVEKVRILLNMLEPGDRSMDSSG